MITNNWIVKRIKNPGSKVWTGPWFSFKKLNGSEQGQANWRALYSYIGMYDWYQVRLHFYKSLKRSFDNAN